MYKFAQSSIIPILKRALGTLHADAEQEKELSILNNKLAKFYRMPCTILLSNDRILIFKNWNDFSTFKILSECRRSDAWITWFNLYNLSVLVCVIEQWINCKMRHFYWNIPILNIAKYCVILRTMTVYVYYRSIC